jgi:putative transposase
MASARLTHGDLKRRRSAGAHRARPTAGEQLALVFAGTWGGARRGAGRKRAERGNVPHRARPRHRATEPVHVTLRAKIAPLRSQHVFPTVRLALLRAARRDPDAFRLLHYSVQHDHLHLLVEARDARALSSGLRSVAIRVARYVNDLLGRRGALWADRWHGRALKTPREVRNAIVYVLANFRKHARSEHPPGIDPYSSAEWFDGWRDWLPDSGRAPPWADAAPWRRRPRRSSNAISVTDAAETASAASSESAACVVVPPRSWLARAGWRRHGRLRFDEKPHR